MAWTRIVAGVMVLLLWLGIGLPIAKAHGGESRRVLAAVPVGNWSLTAWISPAVPRPGEVHVAIEILDGQRPVTECLVSVVAQPLQGANEVFRADALPATVASAFQHEARLNLTEDGPYRFLVTVQEPDGATFNHSFAAFVRPVSAWLTLLIWGQLLLAPILALWLVREGIAIFFAGRSSESPKEVE